MNRSVMLPLMIVALLIVSVGATSYAQTKPGMPLPSAPAQGAISQPSGPSEEFAGPMHHRHSLKAMMKKLGITDEQKKQIRALYVGFKDRTRKTRMDLMSLRDEKKTMLLSGKIDQQKLAQIDDQIVKLVSDLVREKLKMRRDRLSLLTPEQIDRVADWQAERAFRSKMHKMHRGGMRGMHGRDEWRG
jgi:Spy/CpxP family protein refolding chaperone